MRTLLYFVVLWVAVLRPALGAYSSECIDAMFLDAVSAQARRAMAALDPSPEQTHGCLGGHAHVGEDDSPPGDDEIADSGFGQDDDFFVGAGQASSGPPILGRANAHDFPSIAARLISERLDRPPRA